MFEYEYDRDARPNGRVRMLPEVQATPYSNHMPARPTTISRAEYVAEWIRYGVNNRPDMTEVWATIWMYSPWIVAAGSVAVAAADSTLDLGLAQELADIRVNEDDGLLEQTIEGIAHDIGVAAGGEEN